jgi:hypothetical protein
LAISVWSFFEVWCVGVRVATGLPSVNDVAAIVGVMTEPRIFAARYVNGQGAWYPVAQRRKPSATEVIDRWLDVQDDEQEWLDTEAESFLYRIAEHVESGASEAEIAVAVRCACLAGWDWAPISILLGCDRAEARRRFGECDDGSTGSARGRFRFPKRWRPPAPRQSSE